MLLNSHSTATICHVCGWHFNAMWKYLSTDTLLLNVTNILKCSEIRAAIPTYFGSLRFWHGRRFKHDRNAYSLFSRWRYRHM